MRLAILLVVLACAPARAQHDHGADEHHAAHETTAGSHLAAGLAVVAASFDTMLYSGNYQGVMPSLTWSYGRFAVTASGSAYRARENGAEYHGAGDSALHADATLVSTATIDAGAMIGVSIPTGDERHGLGMGHAMVMPALHGAWMPHPRFRLVAAGGYSRAFGNAGHHDHGAWPIVAPMLMAEVSWAAGGDIRLTRAASVGLRASGGIPAGEGGDARAVVGGRVAWHAGRVDTAVEVQAGVVGDPFNVRGVVATTLSF